MPRLFLGTYLSHKDQAALGQLPAFNSTLYTDWNCRIKWSRPSQLHLTWIFFGNVENERVADLCQAISQSIATSRHHLAKNKSLLTYEKLECWFAGKIPRLLALIPTSANANLLSFAKQLRTQLSEYAASDVRQQSLDQFKPHITLARLALIDEQKPCLPSITNDTIDGLTKLLPLTHTLETIALIESTEQNGSHQYTEVQSFPLV